MPTIDSSYGSPTANAYASWTEIDSIVLSSVMDYATWTDAATTLREIAIIRSTRDIDGFRWGGTRYFTNQTLQFPRAVVGHGYGDQLVGEEQYGWNSAGFPWEYYGANLAATTANTLNVEYTRQQQAVKRACAYQVMHRLRMKSGRNRHRERQNLGIMGYSEGIGKLSESYSYGQTSLSLAPEAYDELRDYVGSPTIVRG